jgi:DNA invertase Pin-like site-specific DNA recombinase
MTWAGTFVDEARARTVAFRQRPAARAALAVLREAEGSLLVTERVASAFDGWRDFLSCVAWLEACGPEVWFSDVGAGTAGCGGEGYRALGMLLQFARADCEKRSEDARASCALKKARGRVTNQFAPYGFKLAGAKGHRRLVPDSYTRAVGDQIVRLRGQGTPWEEVYFELLRQGVKTRDGREWSKGSILRAYSGELRLRDLERPRAP